MGLLESAQYIDIPKTVSGTILFGDVANSDWTNANFESGTDYDVFVMGNGFIDPTSQTENGFDYTCTTGTVIFRIFPKKIGAITQVS